MAQNNGIMQQMGKAIDTGVNDFNRSIGLNQPVQQQYA